MRKISDLLKYENLLLNSNDNQILKYKLPAGGRLSAMCLNSRVFCFAAIPGIQAHKILPPCQFSPLLFCP